MAISAQAATTIIATMILDAAREAPRESGAPTGVLYAALCDKMSLNQFNAVIAGCFKAGLCETPDGRPYDMQRNNCIRTTQPKGDAWVDANKAVLAKHGMNL